MLYNRFINIKSQKSKISFFDDDNEKEKNSKPEQQNEKQQPTFLNAFKDKLATQNENEIKKESMPEQIKPQIEIKAQIQQQESEICQIKRKHMGICLL